jgi:hypothetical protein
VAKLLEQATSSDWMSCGGNDACFPREKVIGGFNPIYARANHTSPMWIKLHSDWL